MFSSSQVCWLHPISVVSQIARPAPLDCFQWSFAAPRAHSCRWKVHERWRKSGFKPPLLRRGNGKLRWKWNLKIGHHYKYHYKYHYHKFSSTRWRSQGDGTVPNSGTPGGVDPRRTAARADHGAQTRHVLGSQLEWLQWIVLNWLLNLESRGYHS